MQTTKNITGNVIDGNYIDAPRRSCKPVDYPTKERIEVTIDGKTYERTVYQRAIWRNMGESTIVAEFVIVNDTNYEVAEPTATDMATAKAELLDALKAALAIAEDYQGNSDPCTRERRQGMYATSAIASIIGTLS